MMPHSVSPEVEAVVEARHGDPFSFLGMHRTAAGICVRAMLPGVDELLVVDAADGEIAGGAARIHRDVPGAPDQPRGLLG